MDRSKIIQREIAFSQEIMKLEEAKINVFNCSTNDAIKISLSIETPCRCHREAPFSTQQLHGSTKVFGVGKNNFI